MGFFQALSVEDMVDNVKQIVRQVITSKDKTTPTQSGLEVNILQFFYGYLQRAPENQLINVRSSLVSLMKEGLQLNFPPALFLLLVILRCYVQNIPLQEDKKVRKELQVNDRIQLTDGSAALIVGETSLFTDNLSVIERKIPEDYPCQWVFGVESVKLVLISMTFHAWSKVESELMQAHPCCFLQLIRLEASALATTPTLY